MPDPSTNRPSLSDISHLFLSGVRQKQMGSAPVPRRKPPVRKPSIDLTAEEMQQVIGPESADQPITLPSVTAVIASHLGSRQLDAARLYARHLAASGKRVGLIAIDTSEFRLFRFDPLNSSEPTECTETACFDPRAITDAINELSCDLDYWLILTENTRAPESRSLLRQVSRWVVLSTCDHEGIVACYRALKGLSDLHPAGPSLRIAALDAKTPAEAQAVYHRLANVCHQFLNWELGNELLSHDISRGSESPIISCQLTHDKAQLAAASHWNVVSDFLTRANASPRPDDLQDAPSQPQIQPPAPPATQSVSPLTDLPQEIPMPAAQPRHDNPAASSLAEVIDLPDSDTPDSALIPILIQHWNGQVIETPLRPPMCPDARLAVGRDRRLVLIATAGPALTDLKSISQAYRWVIENRALLAMALPHFALDSHQLPHLRLLVDQADLNPDILKSVLSADTVTVHTFRRVKWGPRTGLLLDAA